MKRVQSSISIYCSELQRKYRYRGWKKKKEKKNFFFRFFFFTFVIVFEQRFVPITPRRSVVSIPSHARARRSRFIRSFAESRTRRGRRALNAFRTESATRNVSCPLSKHQSDGILNRVVDERGEKGRSAFK